MRKKFIGLVLALSLTASLITGCGSSNGDAEAAQTEATTQAAAQTEN